MAAAGLVAAEEREQLTRAGWGPWPRKCFAAGKRRCREQARGDEVLTQVVISATL